MQHVTQPVISPDGFQQAIQLHRAGRIGEAINFYERLLENDRRIAGAWHLLGVARQQQGQVEHSVQCLEQAIALDASQAVFFNNYGVALRASGRFEDALHAFGRALAINPAYSDALSIPSRIGRAVASRPGKRPRGPFGAVGRP